MVESAGSDRVLIQVVEVDDRQIGWSSNVAERLDERVNDVRDGVAKGVSTVAASLDALASPPGWKLDEVTATFGVTLKAEAGVLLTKASGEATLEIAVTFKPTEAGNGRRP